MSDLYAAAFDGICTGAFVVSADHRIYAWNQWMAEKTKVCSGDAIGRTIERLFPGFENKRFDWALSQVIEHRSEQIMSYSLNRYLIPIELESSIDANLVYMPQQVYISPLRSDDGSNLAVVLIIDLTDSVIRSNTLLKVAFKLEEESHRDMLTNVYNRRYLMEWLIQQRKLIQRYHYPISCLLFDLDHFKSINDNYGHEKGDEVLVQFSAIVAAMLRDGDVMVRYGGEEFLVLLTHTDLELALSIAERIRVKINGSSLAGLPQGVLTTSVGVSTWVEGHDECGGVLAMADEALYLAKDAGRNCVRTTQEITK